MGQFLLFLGLITEEKLREAMSLQVATGKRLDRILVSMGTLTEDRLREAVELKAKETVLCLFDLHERGMLEFARTTSRPCSSDSTRCITWTGPTRCSGRSW